MADVPAMAAVTVALWALLETLERGGAWRVPRPHSRWPPRFWRSTRPGCCSAGPSGSSCCSRRAGQVGAGRAGRVPPPRARSPPCSSPSRNRRWSAPTGAAGQLPVGGVAALGRELPLDLHLPGAPAAGHRRPRRPRRGLRGRDHRVLVAAALPLVLFALGARRTRYLLSAFPMIALLAAGAQALPGRARRFACWRRLLSRWSRSSRCSCRSWPGSTRQPAGGRAFSRRAGGGDGGSHRPARAGHCDQPRGRGAAVRLPQPGTDRRPRFRAPPPPAAERRVSRSGSPGSGRSRVVRAGRAPSRVAARVLITGDPDQPLPEALAAEVGGRSPTRSSPGTRFPLPDARVGLAARP